MDDVKVSETAETIVTATPYNYDFIEEAHLLDGKWSAAHKTWTFDLKDKAKVFEVLRKIFCYSPEDSSGETYDVRFRANILESKGSEEMLCGMVIARRGYRDSAVKLHPNVRLISGEFGSSGGSRNHPWVFGKDEPEDILLEWRGVTKSQMEGIKALAGEKFEIVATNNPTTKRAELEQRLRELETEIEKVKEQLASL